MRINKIKYSYLILFMKINILKKIKFNFKN